MKPRDVKRSVRSTRVDRSEGDAPSIGRVARVPGTGLNKGVRRRRRRGESSNGNRDRNNRKKVMFAWSAVFTSLALIAMGTAVWFWLRPQMRHTATASEDQVKPIQERVVSEFESPSEAQAVAMVKSALAVRDRAKVVDHFRIGTTDAAGIVKFLTEMETLDGKISSYSWMSSMDANGMLIDGVSVFLDGADKVRNRLAMLTPDAEGVWKVDFDSFARKVSPEWDEILRNKAEVAVVRVVVADDTYHNGIYKDETQWTCYGMVSPDHEEVLMGYCKKGSPQALALERITSGTDLLDKVSQPLNQPVRRMNPSTHSSRTLNRAVLEIRHAAGAEQRQFEITRVLAEDWVMGSMAFDQNFK
jgi:hypothetical protein